MAEFLSHPCYHVFVHLFEHLCGSFTPQDRHKPGCHGTERQGPSVGPQWGQSAALSLREGPMGEERNRGPRGKEGVRGELHFIYKER